MTRRSGGALRRAGVAIAAAGAGAGALYRRLSQVRGADPEPAGQSAPSVPATEPAPPSERAPSADTLPGADDRELERLRGELARELNRRASSS